MPRIIKRNSPIFLALATLCLIHGLLPAFCGVGVVSPRISNDPSPTTSWTGSTGITTVGTIATGTWQGTDIAATYIADTAVTPGSYTATDLTVDQQGRITAASSGSAAAGWEEVVDNTVSGGAVTTIALGAAFDSDTYDYLIEYEFTEATGGASNLYLYMNNDTTAGNYDRQLVAGVAGAAAGAYAHDARFASLAISQSSTGSCLVKRGSDDRPTWYTNQIGTDSATAMTIVDYGGRHDDTTNVTRLDITASVANSIANGGRVRVYRRAK